MKRQIFLVVILLVFALGTTGFQRGSAAGDNPDPYSDNHWRMLSLVRQITTDEVSDFSRSGSYETWSVLLKNNAADFDVWLSRNEVQGNPPHFSDMPEVLPGIKLRLQVGADGHSFSILVEDISDKNGFAFFSDERGYIREGKYIR